MKYSHIPGTDIKIFQLAVGGMSFGIPAVKTYRWILDEDQTDQMVQHALDLGINFLTPPMSTVPGTVKNLSASH